jgi:putative SOS response-associated peptidase YedK
VPAAVEEQASPLSPDQQQQQQQQQQQHEQQQQQRYRLQAMKWGLVPFWTKRSPDYGTMRKTINCRDDSLAAGAGGMWASMKARKRCVVIAEGFYEWYVCQVLFYLVGEVVVLFLFWCFGVVGWELTGWGGGTGWVGKHG